jgi:uncharacterized protein involved in oxidation of intracellular sulfur
MVRSVVRRGEAAICGTCAKARGFGQEAIIEGVQIGSMELLTDWMLEADQVLVF